MSALTPQDRKLLLAALGAGQNLEKTLSEIDHVRFVRALRDCEAAESELVRRIGLLADKSSLRLGAKHLMALLVPIERLAGRSARDEEFLFDERDGASARGALERKHREDRLGREARIVLCENIRSAFNVGAIFRTLETFGGNEIWLSGYTPDPLKTAMGTDEMLQTRRFDRAAEAIALAKSEGWSVVALENASGATALDEFRWPEKTLLVVGNERFGVDSQTLTECDHVVRISTRGQKNSLNVGVAFGIAAASWTSLSEAQAATNDESFERLKPIGFLRGGFSNPQVAPRQGAYTKGPENTATIELVSRFEGRPSNFAQALQDLDGFDRAWLIFGFHESRGWNPQVRPPRGDGTKRGLFATRSPQRPNRIGISCVRINSVDISKLKISISEHDLLEGTPLFDIKPYLPEADSFNGVKAGWVDQIHAAAFSIEEGRIAHEQIDWLEVHGETRMRNFFDQQLRYQPFDDARKRIDLEGTGDRASLGDHHTIAFRTWRIDFKQVGPKSLEVLEIRGGYTDAELADPSDPYDDKSLHRKFQQRKSGT